jgi:acyl-coenzyme A synthetase/AMP-(fatty) acid ligase
VLAGKPVALKIIISGSRKGWLSFDEINAEDSTAEAAATNADDPLFLFFTSGTTGMPKVVTHTQISYPLGHLTTASWLGLRKGDVHYNISQRNPLQIRTNQSITSPAFRMTERLITICIRKQSLLLHRNR